MRLGYLIEQRDLKTAVSELGQLRESGAVSYGTHPQLAMTWARIAAEQDDLNGFSDRLNQALTAWMWQQNSGSWDVSQAMPGTKNSADVEPYVSAAMAAIQDAAIRYPAETELTRNCVCSASGASSTRLIRRRRQSWPRRQNSRTNKAMENISFGSPTWLDDWVARMSRLKFNGVCWLTDACRQFESCPCCSGSIVAVRAKKPCNLQRQHTPGVRSRR